jgi:hypothetical protein
MLEIYFAIILTMGAILVGGHILQSKCSKKETVASNSDDKSVASDDCGCGNTKPSSSPVEERENDPCWGFDPKDALPTGKEHFIRLKIPFMTDREPIMVKGKADYGNEVRTLPNPKCVEYGYVEITGPTPKAFSAECLKRLNGEAIVIPLAEQGFWAKMPWYKAKAKITKMVSFGTDTPVRSDYDEYNSSLSIEARKAFINFVHKLWKDSPKKELVIYTHGAANSFEFDKLSAYWLMICSKRPVLCYDWTTQGNPIGELFTKANLLGYFQDETNYSLAVPKFKAFDEYLRKVVPGEKIIRVAHSLGNRVQFTLTYFYGGGDSDHEFVVQHRAANWVSGDIDRRYFSEHADKLTRSEHKEDYDVTQGIPIIGRQNAAKISAGDSQSGSPFPSHAVPLNIIIYSGIDRALAISQLVHGMRYPRLGQVGLDRDLPGFLNIDTSAIIARTDPFLMHGQFNPFVNILMEHVVANNCELGAGMCREKPEEIKIHGFVFKRIVNRVGNHWLADFADKHKIPSEEARKPGGPKKHELLSQSEAQEEIVEQFMPNMHIELAPIPDIVIRPEEKTVRLPLAADPLSPEEESCLSELIAQAKEEHQKWLSSLPESLRNELNGKNSP